MDNISRCLFFVLALATIFSTNGSQAVEDVYLKGDKGHFRLEPGKVYHWNWTGVITAPEKKGLPEKTVVSPSVSMGTSRPPEMPPSAVRTTPKSAGTDSQAREGEANVITKEAVSMMMSEIEDAANSKDIDSIAYYLAPELVVLMTVDSHGGRQDLRLNKQEYLEKLQQEFSIPQYHYKFYNLEIFTSQDGKSATVVADIRETVGTNTDVISDQKSAIELRDGQIVVTKIVSIPK